MTSNPPPEQTDIAVIGSTPDSSPTVSRPPPPTNSLASYNPFRMSTDISDTNPFASDVFPPLNSEPLLTPSTKDIRHCISESNLSRLEHETVDHTHIVASRSQENLTDVSSTDRHCVAGKEMALTEEEEELQNDPLDYKNRRVNRSMESSPTMVRKNTSRSSLLQFKPRLEFLAPSGSQPLLSSVSMDLPEISNGKR